ncbi:MAG: aminoacyl-tRNA hydrolase [Bacteroidales bacterium]|nr:aminoacyl-tRNA hydrolase [Bacteroidales bacterium]MBQ2493067.1 aminoacyl-tRNA hydrolase [Bacteroidales bacterium]
MAGKYLIAGLGNIGAEYSGTRHNIGFMVVDFLAEESGAVFHTDRLGSIAEVSYRGSKLILLKPSTYMNLSGKAVSYWMQKENIQKENLLVICDDLAIPFGSVRMRKKGSDGGHNGLGNINQILSSSDYARIRVGIGNGFPRGGQIDYVLGKIEGEEKAQLPSILKRASQGIKDFAFMGVERAMNICNTEPKKETPKNDPASKKESLKNDPASKKEPSRDDPASMNESLKKEPLRDAPAPNDRPSKKDASTAYSSQEQSKEESKELSFKEKLLKLFKG